MTIKRISELTLLGLILLFGLWLRRFMAPPRQGVVKTPYVLPSQDKERVTYNEKTHRVIVTTAEGTATQYARNPTIEIRKTGEVVIKRHVFGLENRPMFGLGYSDTPRVHVGMQFAYAGPFDLAGSIGFPLNPHYVLFQPCVSVGWNLYSNTSIAVGANPLNVALSMKPDVTVLLTIRF